MEGWATRHCNFLHLDTPVLVQDTGRRLPGSHFLCFNFALHSLQRSDGARLL